jgi:hypothetical protein
MTEADCRAAIQAGPMAALQKFGDKAETFCKAYGGKSCMELMAGGLTTGGMQPGMGSNTMQPGTQPGSEMQPGSGMQPGMQPGMGGNTMQTPTTLKG